MNILKAVLLTGLVLVVAACSRTGGNTVPTRTSVFATPQVDTAVLPATPQPTQQSEPIQQARLDPGSYEYMDASAVPLLSAAQRSAANDAQFYALQFGRPGAPRSWSSGGASGQVSVGPYVRVNNRDCREFSHRVTVDGQTFTRSGTACREADGAWGVETA